jgi:hypothetical protein
MTTSGDDVIRITREEACSAHADDLIRRHMSLRGERVSADTPRRWYFQNWLVFMIAGTIAAFGAWMLIEPWYHDYFAVTGTIVELNVDEPLPLNAELPPEVAAEIAGLGWVRVGGQLVWLHPYIKQAEGRRARSYFDPDILQPGQTVRLHTRYYTMGTAEIVIAYYVDLEPRSQKTAEPPVRRQSEQTDTAGLLIFSAVAGFIGLAIGAIDGLVCRLPRRAALGAVVGAVVGALGGLLSGVVADVFYAPLSSLATEQLSGGSQVSRALGFLLQMIARMFAWTLAGMAMGLGQGIALRSKRLLTYGFLGGIIVGLVGGLLFDPIDMVILRNHIDAAISRGVGIVVIGACVGVMIGIVELLARDSWLRMIEGPLAGKEFLIFRDIVNIGASPKSEIYLFNDDEVAQTHATLRVIGDETEITGRAVTNPVLVNGQHVGTARLRHGDRITIGRTSFVYEQRQR